MNKQFIFIALLIFSSFLFCQTAPDWLWASQAGGECVDQGSDIATDSQGNSYITGYFEATASFGNINLTSVNYGDIFVAKLDPNGNWLWAMRAGGLGIDKGSSIAVDSAANVYLTGSFHETADFGSISLVSNGYSQQIFVAKLDTNGNWLWASQAGGNMNSLGTAISTDSNANIYMTGYFEGTATFGNTTLISSGESEAFVAKLDTNGDWLWVKKADGTSYDRGYSIATDTSDSVYFTGYFSGTATFGTTTLTCSGIYDVFVAKLDTNGNWLWAKRAGGTDESVGKSIEVDSSANVYLAGYFSGITTFESTSLSSNGLKDIFAAKLDTNGNWLWAKQAGGISDDYATGIVTDNSGNSYLAGSFQDTATFGSTSLTSSGYHDIYVAKLDTNGNWLWVAQALATYGAEETSITHDISGNSYVTGYFAEGSVAFGSTALSCEYYDILIAKLSSDGVLVTDQLSPSAISSSHLDDAYPNPFCRNSSCVIKADIPPQESGVLAIYNLRGQVVQSQRLFAGAHEISFSGQSLAPGIYLYRLNTPTFNEVKKLILLR